MGRAWKFGDDVSLDPTAAGGTDRPRSDLAELAKHALEDARPEFAATVRPGDFLVAGRNFGRGSSWEHGPVVLERLGVRAVLAKSFARAFFRDAINNGLAAVVCDSDAIGEGDEIEVDLARGVVRDRTRGTRVEFAPFPPAMGAILREGGLLAYVGKFGSFPRNTKASRRGSPRRGRAA